VAAEIRASMVLKVSANVSPGAQNGHGASGDVVSQPKILQDRRMLRAQIAGMA
jgi:hypothetical protein